MPLPPTPIRSAAFLWGSLTYIIRTINLTPDILASRSNLAIGYRAAGRTEEAIMLERKPPTSEP